LIIFPLVRALLPGRPWFAFDELGAAGWFGLFIYLFTIFGCVSATFWWMTVRIDLTTGQIERKSRWGPFTSHKIARLTDFKEMRVKRDGDGGSDVELVGTESMQIVQGWRQSRKESLQIARKLAAHIGMPLFGDDLDDEEYDEAVENAGDQSALD
jgi:hypothetical protein